MVRPKIAISIDAKTLKRLDASVREGLFPNRSQAIQGALEEKLDRMQQRRLARECAKLDPKFERKLAEEGLAEDVASWSEY